MSNALRRFRRADQNRMRWPDDSRQYHKWAHAMMRLHRRMSREGPEPLRILRSS